MQEKLRNEILNVLLNEVIDNNIITKFQTQLDLILYKYNISIKSTELAIIDNTNEIIVKNFLGNKKLEGCSVATINHYRNALKILLIDINKNIPDITTNDIRYHLANWQTTREISTRSLDNMRRVYNTFFKWCFCEKYISENPMARISQFKVQKKHIDAFTESELETLFNACNSIRDRALLEFLYSTGCRVSECVAIDIGDIDFKEKTVLIRNGKGGKERITYISDKCIYWLYEYLKDRNTNDIALWVGKRGRLSKRAVEVIVKGIGDKVGINAHPHKFRHTLATNMVKRNVPVQIVQKILGHEDLSTSMIYIDIDNREVKNAHSKYI